MAHILEEKKKAKEHLEEQHFRLERLTVSVEGHGPRLDALTTQVEALEAKRGMSADLIVIKDDIAT